MAEEWALTRAEAARAKAAGDKARQKMAGQLIAGLKREIQQLGELPSLKPAPEHCIYTVPPRHALHASPSAYCSTLCRHGQDVFQFLQIYGASANIQIFSHSCSRGLEALYVRPKMCCCRDD